MYLLRQILCVMAAVTGVFAAAVNIMGLVTASEGIGADGQFFYLFINGVPISFIIIEISLDHYQKIHERVKSSFSAQLRNEAKKEIKDAEKTLDKLQTRLGMGEG